MSAGTPVAPADPDPPARVVITGLGAVSPLGIGAEALWEGLLAGRSGIGEIDAFDTAEYGVKRGGVVRGFDPLAFMDADLAARAGRASQYAIAATRLALADADLLAAGSADPARVGVCMGTTGAEIHALETAMAAAFQAGEATLDPALLAQVPAQSIPALAAAAFGFAGPNALVPTACAAGNYAIARGLDWIRLGRADVVIAGGADPFSQVAFTGFHKLNTMAPDLPRPFSAQRRGMMVGEGAGALVLERLDRAQARGARIYAEVLGYGLSCDAHHMTAPHPEGTGARAAMTRALADAGVAPAEVGWVCAHGTGTGANDQAESLALRAVFGPDAPPISSLKGALAHTMGAASALEAIATALAVHHGVLPPTANWLGPDAACQVDCVPNAPRQADLRVALSNAYAFGGNNAVIVLARPKARS